MEFELLTLEVSARAAGFSITRPPILKGKSGVEHRFSLLVSDGAHSFAFDFYESVTEVEVLQSYVKKFDTGASTRIVYLGERPSEEARYLAADLNMGIFRSEDFSTIFRLHPEPTLKH